MRDEPPNLAPTPANASERTLQAVGARRATPGAPSPTELVKRLRATNTADGPFVALFDARAIAGERHLLSAWAHLGRARSRQESRLRDRSAEFALYVAGDDQLPRALGKVGVGPSTEQFVVVVERPREVAPTLAEFGLMLDAAAYPRATSPATLAQLGFAPEEFANLPPTAYEGLVLERVAFVDLSAAHGSNPPARSAKKA
jgi:tRNA threonylcarbamoyladenosine modification (KEOPS) complex Cgi121 subunit